MKKYLLLILLSVLSLTTFGQTNSGFWNDTTYNKFSCFEVGHWPQFDNYPDTCIYYPTVFYQYMDTATHSYQRDYNVLKNYFYEVHSLKYGTIDTVSNTKYAILARVGDTIVVNMFVLDSIAQGWGTDTIVVYKLPHIYLNFRYDSLVDYYRMAKPIYSCDSVLVKWNYNKINTNWDTRDTFITLPHLYPNSKHKKYQMNISARCYGESQNLNWYCNDTFNGVPILHHLYYYKKITRQFDTTVYFTFRNDSGWVDTAQHYVKVKAHTTHTPLTIIGYYEGIQNIDGDKQKKLIKVTDELGRESTPEPNKVFIYIYSDGTVKRILTIKE
jgi:hypothetical protein